ncbi:MAG: hypothetical protein ACK5HS_03485 [Mycoplasmatales bacterium]
MIKMTIYYVDINSSLLEIKYSFIYNILINDNVAIVVIIIISNFIKL